MHRGRRQVAGQLAAAVTLLVLLVPAAASGKPIGGARAAHDLGGGSVGWITDAIGAVPDSSLTPVPATRLVDLELTLASRDPTGLAAFTSAVGDPTSPDYRHFLSERAYEDRFGPAAGAMRSVAGYFERAGAARVLPSPDGLGVRVTLTVASARATLGVQYELVTPTHGAPYVTALGVPRLPPDVTPWVRGIDGLADLGSAGLVPHLVRQDHGRVGPDARLPAIVQNRSTGQWWLTGSDMVEAYHETALLPPTAGVVNATYATREVVATILMSGFNATTSTDLPPWDPAVVQSYFNDTFPNTTGEPYAWPQPSLVGDPLTIDGVSPPLPGSLGNLTDDSLIIDENSLDLEMAGSFAPGAQVHNFYFAASLAGLSSAGAASTANLQNVADDFGHCLAQALVEPYTSGRLVSVTNSYGLPDLNDTFWNAEVAHANALGVTVVAASGDQGNAPNRLTGYFQGAGPSWPGTSAFNGSGVVAVGGLTVNVSGVPSGSFDGQSLLDPFDGSVGGFTAMSAWYDSLGGPGHLAGSEGGVSGVIPEPYWQRHSAAQPAIVNATVRANLTQLGRAEPDVAFPANRTIAYTSAQNDTVYFQVVAGTSIASPILAGMLAELSAVSGTRYGYLAPELYRIGSYYAMHPGASGDPLLDVTTGANFLYQSGPGWDPITGWGTLDPIAFLSADANRTIAGYVYNGSSPGLPPPRNPGGLVSPLVQFLIVIVLFLTILFAVFAIARDRRPRGPVPYAAVPAGTYAPTPGGPPPPYPVGPPLSGTPPPATFLCPYCGSVRPAEPVRCPACGAF